MIKKLYQKGGFIYIDNRDDHEVGEINKNFFIINEIYNKKNNVKKKEILKEYYKQKGFIYLHCNSH